MEGCEAPYEYTPTLGSSSMCHEASPVTGSAGWQRPDSEMPAIGDNRSTSPCREVGVLTRAPRLRASISSAEAISRGSGDPEAWCSEEPMCAVCKETMEPIPLFGWVCLNEHGAERAGSGIAGAV